MSFLNDTNFLLTSYITTSNKFFQEKRTTISNDTLTVFK